MHRVVPGGQQDLPEPLPYMYRIIVFGGFWILAGACSNPDLALQDLPLKGGPALKEAVPVSGPAVVLIYDPADCFTCFNSLSEWIAWGRQHPENFLLIFTREPLPAERKQLSTYRIRAGGTLATRGSLGFNTPLEVLFLDRKIVHTTMTPAARQTMLLEYATSHPPEKLTEFPQESRSAAVH